MPSRLIMSRFPWLANVKPGILASFLWALTLSLPGDAVGDTKADLTSTPLASLRLWQIGEDVRCGQQDVCDNVTLCHSQMEMIFFSPYVVFPFKQTVQRVEDVVGSVSVVTSIVRPFSKWSCLPHAVASGYCKKTGSPHNNQTNRRIFCFSF